MSERVFRSKVDAWVWPLLVLAVAGMLAGFSAVMMADTPIQVRVLTSALTVSGVALIVSVLFRTHYTVGDGRIRIASGPFTWNVAIAEITEIRETRNPLSSPALSLDRLKIFYGRRKWIMVSPADKRGFLGAVETEQQTK